MNVGVGVGSPLSPHFRKQRCAMAAWNLPGHAVHEEEPLGGNAGSLLLAPAYRVPVTVTVPRGEFVTRPPQGSVEARDTIGREACVPHLFLALEQERGKERDGE